MIKEVLIYSIKMQRKSFLIHFIFTSCLLMCAGFYLYLATVIKIYGIIFASLLFCAAIIWQSNALKEFICPGILQESKKETLDDAFRDLSEVKE